MDYTTKAQKSKGCAVKNITVSYPWAHNHRRKFKHYLQNIKRKTKSNNTNQKAKK